MNQHQGQKTSGSVSSNQNIRTTDSADEAKDFDHTKKQFANVEVVGSSSSQKVKPKSPILRKVDDLGMRAEITFIDGLDYRLIHPGNRKAMEWKSFSVMEKINHEELLDKSFEFCVEPIGHNHKPQIDKLHPRELEVWILLITRFLSGKLEQEV
jgi:hypothetical protein